MYRITIPFVLSLLFTGNMLKAQVLQWQWLRGTAQAGTSEGRCSVTDPAGNIYVTGNFTGTLALGSYSITASAGKDGFVAKYDSAGTVLWLNRLAGSGDDLPTGITRSVDGSLYVSGSFSGSITLGSSSFTSAGAADAFVCRMDNAGTIAWAKQMGGSLADYGEELVTDSKGNVYVSGPFWSANLTADGFSVSALSSTESDNFYCKLDKNGVVKYLKKVPSGYTGRTFNGLAMAKNDQLYMAFYTPATTLSSGAPGNVNYAVRFGSWAAFDTTGYLINAGTFYNSARYYMSGIALDSSNTLLHNRTFINLSSQYSTGGNGGGAALSNAVKDSRNIVVNETQSRFALGGFTGPNSVIDTTAAYFDNTRNFASNGTDLYITWLTNDGTLQDVKTTRWFGNANEWGNHIAADNVNGCLYITGRWSELSAGAKFYVNADTLSNAGFFLLKVRVPALPLTAFAGADKTICSGTGGAAVLGGTPVVKGGKAPYTYLWSPAAGLSSTTVPAPAASPAVSTNYILAIQDAEGNIARDTVLVSVVASPPAPAIAHRVGSNGFDTLVCTPAATAYLWSNGATTDRVVISNTGFGIFSVRVTNPAGCTATSVPFYYKLVKPNAGPDTTICAGQAVTIGGTPAYYGDALTSTPTFAWIPPSYLDNGVNNNYPVATPPVTTVYRKVVMTNGGANSSQEDTMTVFVLQPGQVNPLAGFAGQPAVQAAYTVSAYTVMNSSNCRTVGCITPSGSNPVSGLVNARVKVETSLPLYNNTYYAVRHYDFEPVNNAAAATAIVTLYFRPEEMAQFNANAGALHYKLPVNPGDNTDSVRIEQFHGTGTNPADYTGTREVFSKANGLVINYNTTIGAWEIQVPVTGFSGFWLTSKTAAPIPVLLNYITGNISSGKAQLIWKVTCINSDAVFHIERSADGRRFERIGTIQATELQCLQPFFFTDAALRPGKNIYRIQMIDNNGRALYTPVVVLLNKANAFELVSISAADQQQYLLNISSSKAVDAEVVVTDMAGRRVIAYTQRVSSGYNQLPLRNGAALQKGTYAVTVYTATGSTGRMLVKL